MNSSTASTEATGIIILGSTGSIGTQTLDIVREQHGRFQVIGLSAGSNWELLARQAREFKPKRVVIADKGKWKLLREALADLPIVVEAGDEAIASLAAMTPGDIVVTAMVGYSGLAPTIHAIGAGKRIALANKETLVVAGQLISRLAKEAEVEILPVDSEHSAIFQCLVGEDKSKLKKIILTASGGPFRTLSADQLSHVSVADALHHPNWNMGAKVTIDSASMMNKGFEMIEARWLFDCPPEKIKILVHPQSVIHSMVEFCDGSVKAQLGVPDMRLPIRYALGFPERLNSSLPGLLFEQYSTLTFETPDKNKFPLLDMAFKAIERGGNIPCALNAANEVAVDAFLREKIKFTQMADIIGKVIDTTDYIKNITLRDLIDTHAISTCKAREIVDKLR